MREKMETWLAQVGVLEQYQTVVATIILILGVLFIAWIVDLIAKRILLRGIKKVVLKTENTFDEMLYEKKIFHNIAHIAPAVVLYGAAEWLQVQWNIQGVIYAYIITIAMIIAFKVIDVTIDVYRTKEFSKSRPIKGLMQVVKILVALFGGIIIIGIFTEGSTAWALLSSVGGMSAIIILVFKDSILGLVAGIQLSANNQLKIGDWIEMPKFGADGEVIDISLTNVTVSNWDKTLTNIPAYKFIDESFKNWQGMAEAGGRRIKRAIHLDMTSIGFLDQELRSKLGQVEVLQDYMKSKEAEISTFNQKHTEGRLNTRDLTNIGTFRKYALEYIKASPKIRSDYTLLVRQLAPTDKGLPIEIYCFTNETAWAAYEGIMADIFDHLLAVLPEFGLRVYQNPTGNDFQNLTE